MPTITIPKGATLSGLASQYKTTVNDLLKANPNIINPNLIIAGASLNLPTTPAAAPAASPVVSPTPTGSAYVIKSGDTLSALAKANNTSIAEIMKLNPNITNPNLIYAGKSLTLPGGLSGEGSNVSDYSGVSTLDEANKVINSGQEKDAASKSASGEPETRKTTNDVLAEILGTGVDTGKTPTENLKTALSGGAEKPATPNLVETYNKYRTQYGVDSLETNLTDLQAQKDAAVSAKTTRVNAERGKTVATNVIEGRVSQVEREENERITAIDNQITTVTNQLTTKYNVISNLMTLTEKDYDNASADYNAQMSQNVSIFNALKGISEDAKSEIEKAEDDARSSLQIVYNAIQSGGLSLKDVTADQKALITKLEAQSGLPVGFYQSLQNKNPKAEVVGTYNWTGSDNKEYVSVLTKDPDTGEIKTNNIVLGTAKATGTGSTATTEELNVYYKQNMETELKKAAGADGYVSPTDWAKARKAWSANTPYDATKFDENFRGYVNPNDPFDYAGFEGYRKGFIKK